METLYETLKNISQEIRNLNKFGIGHCKLELFVSEKGFENFYAMMKETAESQPSALENPGVPISLSITHDKKLDEM